MDRFDSINTICAYENFMRLSADDVAMEGVSDTLSSAVASLKRVLVNIGRAIVTAIRKVVDIIRRKSGADGQSTVNTAKYKAWADMVSEAGYIIDTICSYNVRDNDSSDDGDDAIKEVVAAFKRLEESYDKIDSTSLDPTTMKVDAISVDRTTKKVVDRANNLAEILSDKFKDKIMEGANGEDDVRQRKLYIAKMRRTVSYAMQASTLLTKATNILILGVG